MELKYYGKFLDVEAASKYYQEAFEATIIKTPGENKHGYIKLFGDISLHMYQVKTKVEVGGRFILRFSKEDASKFLNAYKRIKDIKGTKLVRDIKDARWGTTYFEIKDPFDISWVLEVSTDDLNQA